MRVVRLAKKRFVIGLWWQVQDRSQKLKRQARALNQEIGENYTHVVLRETQLGMGKGKGIVCGLPSLASAVADFGGGHVFICHFPDMSCWWVCAVKDGVIAAEGDWVCASESEAMEHAEYMRLMLDIQRVEIVEDNKDVCGKIVDVMKPHWQLWMRGRPHGRVQKLSSSLRPLLMFVSAVLTLLAVFMAYSAGIFSDDSMMRLLAEKRRMEILSNPGSFFPRPWLSAPSVKAWSERCTNYLLQIPFTENGWDLREATCTGDSVDLKWEYTESASFLHLPDGAELLAPTIAHRRLGFEMLPSGQGAGLLTRDSVARRLYELARLLGLHLTLSWKDRSSKTISEGSLSVAIIAPWHEGVFAVDNVPSMIILDKDLYEALHTIPGLVLQSISYSGGSWKIKGLCHGT